MLYGFQPCAGSREGLVVVRVAGVFVHLGGPPNFGQDAPGRICGQATAQKHQGPQERWDAAGPGTTAA